ncbi:alpha/beta fold hydrolase [Georgenia satyanarayanai]|uniref:alpha/beta fold hydrolase n=1 Tax=Georgenia satyanarayanai TaxID=860221 RepID=UPI0015E87C4F|nr:alpha/beta hydrolase [Georgenia satyanarayanai]
MELEVVSYGAGEPVAVIQTALTGDELLPFTELLAQGTGLRAIHVARRGYGTVSGPGKPTTTIADMAADCRDVIEALGVVPSHVVGASFSCAVALASAVLAPSHVRSLTLVEPPPLDGPGAEQFRAATAGLIATATARGTAAALDEFMPQLYGQPWREAPELAGSDVAALERDAETFFAIDLPALLAWRADPTVLAGVHCPVMVVGGAESGAWFREAQELLVQWLPRAEQVTVAGAGHLLAGTHPRELAGLTAEFVGRHR